MDPHNITGTEFVFRYRAVCFGWHGYLINFRCAQNEEAKPFDAPDVYRLGHERLLQGECTKDAFGILNIVN